MKKIPRKYSDEQLVKGMLAKDSEMFAALYSYYFPQLILLANRYAKYIVAAEEIVQDVFLKIWERPPQLDNSQLIRAYLCRAVVHSAINYIKHQKVVSKHQGQLNLHLSDEYLDELYEAQELKTILYKEIDLLPPQCQKVFKMSRFEGLRYAEIAKELNISEKTVEHHMVKALKILKAKVFSKILFPKDILLGFKAILCSSVLPLF